MRDVSQFPTIAVASCDAEIAAIALESLAPQLEKMDKHATAKDARDAAERIRASLKRLNEPPTKRPIGKKR